MLPTWAKALVATLLLLSLAFYITWVIAEMVAFGRRARGHGEIITGVMDRLWLGILLTTILLALGAAAMLGVFYSMSIFSGSSGLITFAR